MVEAPRQPFLRITSAALPVKAAYFTERPPSARSRARVDLPVPAQPNRRKTCGPSLSLSQLETASSAASCCGDQVGISRRKPGETWGCCRGKHGETKQELAVSHTLPLAGRVA